MSAGTQPGRVERARFARASRPFQLVIILLGLITASVLQSAPPSRAQEPSTYFDPDAVVALAERRVCSLLSERKLEVGVRGHDHGDAVELGGTIYWTFGDTFLTDGSLIPSMLATTGDRDARDCIDLEPHTSSGSLTPMLHQAADELTVWPIALAATGDDNVHFYYTSVVSDPVDGWRVQGTGIGSFDTKSLTQRVGVSAVLARGPAGISRARND